jgi:hypothetical protein
MSQFILKISFHFLFLLAKNIFLKLKKKFFPILINILLLNFFLILNKL